MRLKRKTRSRKRNPKYKDLDKFKSELIKYLEKLRKIFHSEDEYNPKMLNNIKEIKELTTSINNDEYSEEFGNEEVSNLVTIVSLYRIFYEDLENKLEELQDKYLE